MHADLSNLKHIAFDRTNVMMTCSGVGINNPSHGIIS